MRVGAILPPLTIILSCSHDILERRAAWRISMLEPDWAASASACDGSSGRQLHQVGMAQQQLGRSLAQGSDPHNNNPPPPTFSRQKSSLVWDCHDFV